MRLFYRICAYAMGLGLIHTALTPLFYPRLDEDALWFAGTGLALIYAGLLNLAAERTWQAWFLNLCIPANLVMLVFCGLIFGVMPAPQSFLGLAFAFALTLASVLARLSLRAPQARPA